MPPNTPNLFMPSNLSRPPVPSRTSPHQRIRTEDLRRELVQSQPEIYQNESAFGSIPGIPVGKTWRTREECSRDRVHTPTTAGIARGKDGAPSIVMSGGYSDDDDQGDFIVYTGAGGNESRWGGGQVEDQSFDHVHNNSLVISYALGKPVRVVRGHELNSKYAPYAGYRYDGLYKVTKYYLDKSKDGGYDICRFEMRREPNQGPIPTR